MDPFRPTISHLRIERPPGKFEPGPIEVCAKLVDARHPDHHGSRVCDKAETFLTLAQSRFGPFQIAVTARTHGSPLISINSADPKPVRTSPFFMRILNSQF